MSGAHARRPWPPNLFFVLEPLFVWDERSHNDASVETLLVETESQAADAADMPPVYAACTSSAAGVGAGSPWTDLPGQLSANAASSASRVGVPVPMVVLGDLGPNPAARVTHAVLGFL